MTGVVYSFQMVLQVLHALPGQLPSKLVLVDVAPPLLNNAEHDSAAVCRTVLAHHTLSRVVEDAIDNTIDGPSRVNSLVIPALHKLGDHPLEDLGRELACGFVENLSGQQRSR
jgi:hypothetical protein